MTKEQIYQKLQNTKQQLWNLQEELATIAPFAGAKYEDLPSGMRLIMTLCHYPDMDTWIAAIKQSYEKTEKKYWKLFEKLLKEMKNEKNV